MLLMVQDLELEVELVIVVQVIKEHMVKQDWINQDHLKDLLVMVEGNILVKLDNLIWISLDNQDHLLGNQNIIQHHPHIIAKIKIDRSSSLNKN